MLTQVWVLDLPGLWLVFSHKVGNHYIPATVDQQLAQPLVFGEVLGSNLGPTPRRN